METVETAVERVTRQFYEWELRGRGWLLWPETVALEPPFRPFNRQSANRAPVTDDGVVPTIFSRLSDAFFGSGQKRASQEADEENEESAPASLERDTPVVELQISFPPDADPELEVLEQCLLNTACRLPLSFELIGLPGKQVIQMTGDSADVHILLGQLQAHFPAATITSSQGFLTSQWDGCKGDQGIILEYGLEREFMLPLRCGKAMATDPYVGLCASLDDVQPGEMVVYQILFQSIQNPWAAHIMRSVTTWDGKPFFENAPELTKAADQKTGRPLFAAVARVAVISRSEARVKQLLNAVAGMFNVFSDDDGNALQPLDNEDVDFRSHSADLHSRTSRRSGMILNCDELTSLAHFPSSEVRSKSLRRDSKRTKEAPAIVRGEGLKIGENYHAGKTIPVSLSPSHRVRHTHVIGASGTGKSTLLLEMIRQDILAGNGLCVLDPHGDLIDDILGLIPEERIKDVILFDPADEEFPIGFNILSAHSSVEKNLLASDLVGVFRRLSTAWGDNMTSVLGNAILAFLESSKGGTLPELRRFLIEADYRKEFLKTVTDPDIVYYWEYEYPILKSQSLGSLLTRLDTFLRPKAIRYMVGQPQSKLDFTAIMDGGKILLAKLSQGIIGEENAYLLGALLVSKIYQLTIARQLVDLRERRPFILYVDEFHNFVTPSMAAILAGARKYNLGLVLAHQELRQLQRDGEVASAVISNPCTRICFRVGDDDARKLAEGFSFFESKDLQGLGVGEAICRVERADYDFNLSCVRLPAASEAIRNQRRTQIKEFSRSTYGTPKATVEGWLAEMRQPPTKGRRDPFAERFKPKPNDPTEPGSEDAIQTKGQEPNREVEQSTIEGVPEVIPSPEQVESEHQSLKQRILVEAENLEYTVALEESVLDGQGRVDVTLRRGQRSVACEITVTTTVEHEVGNILKCLQAGFGHVALICTNPKKLAKVETEATKSFTSDQMSKVGYYQPQEFLTKLLHWSESEPLPHDAAGTKPRKRKINIAGRDLSDEERSQTERNMLKHIILKMKNKTK